MKKWMVITRILNKYGPKRARSKGKYIYPNEYRPKNLTLVNSLCEIHSMLLSCACHTHLTVHTYSELSYLSNLWCPPSFEQFTKTFAHVI